MIVSVVIPFHQVDLLLERTITNIVPQIVEGVSEIILIGDGVDDQEIFKLKKLYNSINSLAIFSIPKSGANCARNHGVGMAKGGYILFVDSDDILKSGSLNLYTQIILTCSPDIIIGNVEKVMPLKGVKYYYFFEKTERLLNKEQLSFNDLYHFPVLICKCIKRKHLTSLPFLNSKMYQDVSLTALLFPNVESFFFTNIVTYSHMIRQGSTSSLETNTMENLESASRAFVKISEYYKQKNLTKEEKYYWYFFVIRFYYTLIRRSVVSGLFEFGEELRMGFVKQISAKELLKSIVVPKAFLIGLMLKSKILFRVYCSLLKAKKKNNLL